jgi:hypothetical protein
MDHEERRDPRPPIPDWSTVTSSRNSASARQLARNKGLAWVSAITFGAGAAGVLGAGALAISLPSTTSTSASSASSSASTSTSANTSEDDSGSSLQAAPAPASSNIAPVATTGAS